MITGGTVSYGETRKIADYENKNAKVELSFNVPEGQPDNVAINTAKDLAINYCKDMLRPPREAPVLVRETVTEAKPVKAKPPKMPAPEHLVSVALTEAITEEITNATPLCATEIIEKAKLVDTLSEPVKEITDAEIMDATSKHQQQVKNAPAIRKLINEMGIKCPPDSLITMPQDRRAAYLKRLPAIKPLA